MRNRIFTLLIVLITNPIYGQIEDVFGLYVSKSFGTVILNLKPSFTYTYKNSAMCGPAIYKNSGNYSIIGDTIFLESDNSEEPPKEFFKIRTNVNLDSNFLFWERGSIAEIYRSDTILSKIVGGRLSDHKGVYYGNFSKTKSYFKNGITRSSKDELGKYMVETIYFNNGQIREIRKFKKTKRVGEWVFFDRNGNIKKVEKYKNDKLKNKLTNSNNRLILLYE